MIVFVKKCFILTEGGCHLIFTCSKITIYELSFSKLKYHIRQLFSLEHLIYRWNINIIQKKIGFIYILVLPATFEKQRDNFVLRDNFGPYCKIGNGCFGFCSQKFVMTRYVLLGAYIRKGDPTLSKARVKFAIRSQ